MFQRADGKYHNCKVTPGSVCRCGTYKLLVTRMLALSEGNRNKAKNQAIAQTLKFLNKMLVRQEWAHLERKELEQEIEEARGEYHKQFGGELAKLIQLRTELYAQLRDLIPARFIYYTGEIKYLDRGVYRETDGFFTLVNEIWDLPEWDEDDWYEIQRHLHQAQQACLHPNMPRNLASPHEKINAFYLKYMLILCKQFKTKARETTDSLIERLNNKRESQLDIAKLYLRLKDTDRKGVLRLDYLTEEQEKAIKNLIAQAKRRSNGSLGWTHLPPQGPRSLLGKKEEERRRIMETEDSISTTDLIRKLYMTPLSQWSRRDLMILRIREEKYNQNQEGSGEKMESHPSNNPPAFKNSPAIRSKLCKTTNPQRQPR